MKSTVPNRTETEKGSVDEAWSLLLSLYAVIILSTSLLALVEQSKAFLFVAVAGCIAHAVVVGPKRLPMLSGLGLNLCAVVVFLLFARTFDPEAFKSGFTPAHLIICLLIVKLFGPHRLPDLRVIQVTSLFVMLVAARWAMSIFFLPLFLLAGGAVMFNSMVVAMRRPPNARPRKRVRLGDVAAGMRVPAALVLAIAIVLFMAFPRVRLTRARSGPRLAGETGFSQDVSLRDIGRIRESFNVALRARFFQTDGSSRPIPIPKELMRGVSYVTYESGRWGQGVELTQRASRVMDPGFTADPHSQLIAQGVPIRRISQQVVLEANTSNVLFMLYRPVAVNMLDGDGTREDRIGHTFRQSNVRWLRGSVQYEAISEIADIADSELRRAGCPDRVEEWGFFWDYPPEIETTLQGTINDIEAVYRPATDFDRVRSVEMYLRNPRNFAYSLDLPDYGSMEPLEAFLTHTRVGSCEQFASAMVLIVRAWGMPARLVGGYKGGELDEENKQYVFRDRDAHAWVEVFFNDYGWVEFDPTPGAANASLASLLSGNQDVTMFDRMGSLYSGALRAAERRWHSYVYNYGSANQKELLRSFEKALKNLDAYVGPSAGASRRGMGLLGVLAVIGGILVFALGLHAALGTVAARRRTHMQGGSRAEGFYAEMLKMLRKRGITRPAHFTPREFARQVRSETANGGQGGTEMAESIETVTGLYCLARFGQRELTTEQVADAERALRGLRSVLTGKRR